ncbi:MAG: hypothetical protein WDN26_08310 [Chitinophagaceae bacterium]
MLSKEQKDEECDATDDDSPRDAAHSNAVGLIMRRPDCIGISLRSTTDDDSSNTAGLKKIFQTIVILNS